MYLMSLNPQLVKGIVMACRKRGNSTSNTHSRSVCKARLHCVYKKARPAKMKAKTAAPDVFEGGLRGCGKLMKAVPTACFPENQPFCHEPAIVSGSAARPYNRTISFTGRFRGVLCRDE